MQCLCVVQPAEVHKWGGEGRQNVHIKRGLDKRGGVRDLESEHKDMAVAIVMRVWCSVGRLGRGGLNRGRAVSLRSLSTTLLRLLSAQGSS